MFGCVVFISFKLTEMADKPVFGIDLGTTNSCIGCWKNGNVEICPNQYGQRTTPSYVAFVDGGILVGDAAVAQQQYNSRNTIFEAKRHIGQNFEKAKKDAKFVPFGIGQDNKGRPIYEVKQQYYPERISAMVLRELKSNVEAITDLKVFF